MKKQGVFFFAFLIIVGCSAQPDIELPEHIQELDNLSVVAPDAEPASEINLNKVAAFGDTEEVILGRRISGTAVDHEDRIYIADYSQNTIHVYRPDGSHLQSVGRQGNGPGEFQAIIDIQVDSRSLYILDGRLNKLAIFNIETYSHQADHIVIIDQKNNPPPWQERVEKNRQFYRPSDFYPLSTGNLLIFFSDQAVATSENLDGRTYEASIFSTEEKSYIEHGILSFPWTGRVLIDEQGGANNFTTVMRDIPYKRSSQFDYSNGQIVHGWTDEFLFKFYNEDGTYQKALYAPISGPELSLDIILDYYGTSTDRTREIFRNDDLPDTWPSFDNAVLDDKNRLWVSTFNENVDQMKWLVLEPSGELLATFEWPSQRDLKHVKNGFAYAMETDPETGLQQLVKYEIEMR